MKRMPIAVLGLLLAGAAENGCVPVAEDDYPPDASPPNGSGGANGSGGSLGSGGASSGGAVGSGGSTIGSGGVASSGGAVGSGGATFGSGGAVGSGGSITTGGRSGTTGGRSGTTGGRSGTTGGRSGTTGGRSGAAGGRSGAAGGSSGTFAQVSQLLGTSCGTGTCHNGNPHTDLRNTTGLHARLVNAVPAGTGVATGCRALTLVVAGSPSTSLLSQIVKAPVTACGTSRMPDTCSTTSTMPRACLTTAQISTIDAWITAGAPM
jgi:hypothetical protein